MKNSVSFCRRVLVWLMLLAIPFQGIASAAMLSCAHAAAQHGAASVTADTGHAVRHGQPAGHCEDMASMAQAGHAAAQPDHGADGYHGHSEDHDRNNGHSNDHNNDHDSRCSACAACCMAAAMAPAPVPVPAPHDLRACACAPAADRVDAVDLALPERPPRFPFA